MIWSVSTAERFSGAAMPVWVVNFSMSGSLSVRGRSDELAQIAGTGECAAHGGGRCDERRDQVRAAALALASFEVAVARGGAALPRCELVGIHAQAHRAPGEAPLGTERLEDLVEPLGLGLQAHAGRARHDHD